MSVRQQTREYTEVVEFYILPGGMELLKPSAVDLALKRAEIADLEDALAGVYGADGAEADVPEPVARARALLAAGEEDCAEARRELAQWDVERRLRWATIQERLRQAQMTLREMDAPPDPSTPVRRETYRVRKFTRGEFLTAQGEHTEVNQEMGTSTVDFEACNDVLLKATLVGKTVAGVDGEPREEPLAEPRDMEHQVADVLIRRMLANNSVTPQLVRFFRGGG